MPIGAVVEGFSSSMSCSSWSGFVTRTEYTDEEFVTIKQTILKRFTPLVEVLKAENKA